MNIKDIPEFERTNDLKINVFALNKTIVSPVYTKKTNSVEHRLTIV